LAAHYSHRFFWFFPAPAPGYYQKEPAITRGGRKLFSQDLDSEPAVPKLAIELPKNVWNRLGQVLALRYNCAGRGMLRGLWVRSIPINLSVTSSDEATRAVGSRTIPKGGFLSMKVKVFAMGLMVVIAAVVATGPAPRSVLARQNANANKRAPRAKTGSASKASNSQSAAPADMAEKPKPKKPPRKHPKEAVGNSSGARACVGKRRKFGSKQTKTPQ